jgi:hypothetical protein
MVSSTSRRLQASGYANSYLSVGSDVVGSPERLPPVKGAHKFWSYGLDTRELRNSNRPCTKHHSFHTKCYLQMAYYGSDSTDDMKEVDLGAHPEVVDEVLLVVSFIFRHSPSSL